MCKTLIAIIIGMVLSLVVSVASAATPNPAIKPVPPEYEQTIRQYDNFTNKWADYYGVPRDLVRRMMWFESRGNKWATSPAGAMGLMQIMPYHFTASEKPYDPETNIKKACAILKGNYDRGGKSWVQAVKMYFGVVGADYWGTTAETYVAAIFDYSRTLDQPKADSPKASRVFPIPDYKATVAVETHWGAGVVGASDLFAPRGAKVVSVASGTVYFVRNDASGGNCVYIEGDDGLWYYYAHLDKWPLVKDGQHVEAGTLIGYVGNTGSAKTTDPHLHIGIGYGVADGLGPNGGSGIGFNAVALLRTLKAQ